MRKILTVLALSLCCMIGNIQAKPVSPETASRVAENFADEILQAKSELLETNRQKPKLLTDSKAIFKSVKSPSYYIFSLDPGWCIISADDAARPVLAYSTESDFNLEKIPAGMKYWLELYNNEIQSVQNSGANGIAAFSDQWNRYIYGAENSGKILTVVVSPLVKSYWSQETPYNNYCPSYKGSKCVTGCVATAMSQIMQYWNFPRKGTGSRSYTSSTHTLNCFEYFDTLYFDWNNMLYSYSSYYTDRQAAAVAHLMYACGVASMMDYDPSGSGAQMYDAADALQNYFYYHSDYEARNNYKDSAWYALLQSQLDAAQPIEYCGYSVDENNKWEGHAFVCDGYNTAQQFHFNMGWAGYGNGYFALSSLSAGQFNQSQSAIVDISPMKSNLVLADVFEISNKPAVNSEINLTLNYQNIDTNPFSGEIFVKLFKSGTDSTKFSKAFMDLGLIKTGSLVPQGKLAKALNYATYPLMGIPAGDYVVTCFYRSDYEVNPKMLAFTKGISSLPVHISDSKSDCGLEFSAAPAISSDSVNRGSEFTFSASGIKNYSNAAFNGTIYAVIDQYGIDSAKSCSCYYAKQHIAFDSLQNISIAAGETIHGTGNAGWKFTYNTNSLREGKYYVTLAGKKSGSDSSYVLGSGGFVSVLPFNVITSADKYENNNTVAEIYKFDTTHASIEATITPGDTDYYRIPLDRNLVYSLKIKALDGKSDSLVHSCDVVYKVFKIYKWTDTLDYEYSDDVSKASYINIMVYPKVQGETGTYHLDVNLDVTAGVEEAKQDFNLILNSASQSVVIRSLSGKYFDKIMLFDASGHAMEISNDYTSQKEIDISRLSCGKYFVEIRSGGKNYLLDFVITR